MIIGCIASLCRHLLGGIARSQLETYKLLINPDQKFINSTGWCSCPVITYLIEDALLLSLVEPTLTRMLIA